MNHYILEQKRIDRKFHVLSESTFRRLDLLLPLYPTTALSYYRSILLPLYPTTALSYYRSILLPLYLTLFRHFPSFLDTSAFHSHGTPPWSFLPSSYPKFLFFNSKTSYHPSIFHLFLPESCDSLITQ